MEETIVIKTLLFLAAEFYNFYFTISILLFLAPEFYKKKLRYIIWRKIDVVLMMVRTTMKRMKVTTTEYSFLKLGGHGYQD